MLLQASPNFYKLQGGWPNKWGGIKMSFPINFLITKLSYTLPINRHSSITWKPHHFLSILSQIPRPSPWVFFSKFVIQVPSIVLESKHHFRKILCRKFLEKKLFSNRFLEKSQSWRIKRIFVGGRTKNFHKVLLRNF